FSVFVNYIRRLSKDPEGFHYQWKWWELPYNKIIRWRNVIQYNRLLKNNVITNDHLKASKYFVWPLHFHPEAATLILGRKINDQLALIEIISKNLPID